jgi:transposase
LLILFKERGWLKERQCQRTDSTHVLAKVRAINRLMCVGEAMRFALNSLAIVAGDWLLAHSDSAWMDRYGHRIEEGRFPRSQADRQLVAEVIGDDGWTLLADIFDPAAPTFLREVPAVQILRQIWVQNYRYENGHLFWREQNDIPPATTFINSPYDPEARFGKKRSTMWTGYKIHLTETCEENMPHLITHVSTTAAPRTDEALVDVIHMDLQRSELLPNEHLLDSGYVTSHVLSTSSERFGVEVIGPTLGNVRWQANTDGGIDASQFVIDWERKHAICPQGNTSISWTPALDNRNNEIIKIRFSTKDCQVCPCQSRCTHSQSRVPRRLLSVRPQEQYEALQAARRRQQTTAFTQKYNLRQGVEATISQGVRAFGMRRSRYIGEAKTHLQHLGIAAAINITRLFDWLDGNGPAPRRVSAFQRLYFAA